MRLPAKLCSLLLAFFVLGLIYDQSTPIFEASDEVWHYGVVSELAAGRGLPVQRIGEITTYRQEGSQPPLYYVLGAALIFWIDDADDLGQNSYNPFAKVGVPGTYENVNMVRLTQSEGFPYSGLPLAVHLLRWFSLLLGCGTVALTYLLAQELFPRRYGLALLAGGVTAFNPMVVFISASVNNDNGIWLLSSLTMYVLVLAVKGDSSTQSARMLLLRPANLPWTLGVLLGLSIITKLSGLLLAPVVAAFLLWRLRCEDNRRQFWRDGIIIVFCVLVLTGWWFYRNWVLYGELLGTRMMAQLYGFARSGEVSVPALLREWRGWWYSLWGVFGAFNVLPGKWVYSLFTVLVAVAIFGGMRTFRSVQGYVESTAKIRIAHNLMLLFIVLTIVANVYWSLSQHALQGRLALGAVAVMSTYLAAGVTFFVGKSLEQRIAYIITVVLFIVSLVVAIVYIAPRYRQPKPMMETDLPTDIVATDANFNDEIELIGYIVHEDVLRPGENVQVTLYWRGLKDIDPDYNLSLNVHGRDMENVAKLDTWPGGGLLPTGDWLPGVVYADRYLLPLSLQASAPTLLWLDVSFWQDSLNDRLSINSSGSSIGSLMLGAGRLWPTDIVRELAQVNNGSTFVHGITLAGHTLLSQSVSETIFMLYWLVDQPMSTDWTVFVHMVNAAGEIVSQSDGPPLNGYWPTSVWEPGQVVRDSRRLAYPVALPSGGYSVLVGLYDPTTGLRASAIAPNGSEWIDSAVHLMTVSIVE